METKRQLRKDLTSLKEDLDLLKWKLEHTPKFHYGDNVTVKEENSYGICEWQGKVVSDARVETYWDWIYFVYDVLDDSGKRVTREHENSLRLSE